MGSGLGFSFALKEKTKSYHLHQHTSIALIGAISLASSLSGDNDTVSQKPVKHLSKTHKKVYGILATHPEFPWI